MAAPRSARPVRDLNVHLDGELMTRVDLVLFSEVDQRVPKGAYKAFFNGLLRQFFEHRGIDLGPLVGLASGEVSVRGDARSIEVLQRALAQQGEK